MSTTRSTSWWQIAAISAVMYGYAALGHEAVRVWQSNLTLWHNAIKFAPTKPRPHINYVKALFGAGREIEALAHFQIVVDLEDRRGE